MTTVIQNLQKPHAGQLITLFELDCTDFAEDTILRFTSSVNGEDPITWNGVEFTPVDIEAEGFEYNSRSAFPTPIIRLSNVTKLASALVITNGDLIGARLTRIRTFREFLDDGDSPDPAQIFMPDVYVVEQKIAHNSSRIEWKLSASIDQQGTMLPNFVMVRDYCARVYRRPDGAGSFKYEKATCPYAGTSYFNANNQSTTAANDVCAKTLFACELRFGANQNLPFKGFPGLARFR